MGQERTSHTNLDGFLPRSIAALCLCVLSCSRPAAITGPDPDAGSAIGPTGRPRSAEHTTLYAPNRRYLQMGTGQPFPIIGFGNEGRNTPAVMAQLAGKINYQRASASSWDRNRSANEYALGRPWPDVNNKSDMSVWNETYWESLRDYLDHARDAGITVGLLLWDGHSDLPGGKNGTRSTWNSQHNVQGVQWAYNVTALNQYPNPSPNGTSAEKLVYYQRRWIDRLLVECAGYPNVIFELDNETDQAPTAWWLWWADYILRSRPYVIATTWNATHTIPDPVFSTDSRVHMKSYHERDDGVITSQRYGWNKIIVADADNSCTNLDGASARRIAWRSLLRGGHWNDFVCIDTAFPDTQKLQYYGHILKFLDASNVPLWTMAPHNELVTGGLCMALPGGLYLVYADTNVTVNLSALTGSATWSWYNPRTGVFVETGQVTGGGQRTFNVPVAINDYVLYITSNAVAGVEPPRVEGGE